jgi:hypothetical protein
MPASTGDGIATTKPAKTHLAGPGPGHYAAPVHPAQLNHLLDIGAAEPDWLGPANAAVLWLATTALALTLHAARQPTTRSGKPLIDHGGPRP